MGGCKEYIAFAERKQAVKSPLRVNFPVQREHLLARKPYKQF